MIILKAILITAVVASTFATLVMAWMWFLDKINGMLK
jgi:hypothetical protein